MSQHLYISGVGLTDTHEAVLKVAAHLLASDEIECEVVAESDSLPAGDGIRCLLINGKSDEGSRRLDSPLEVPAIVVGASTPQSTAARLIEIEAPLRVQALRNALLDLVSATAGRQERIALSDRAIDLEESPSPPPAAPPPLTLFRALCQAQQQGSRALFGDGETQVMIDGAGGQLFTPLTERELERLAEGGGGYQMLTLSEEELIQRSRGIPARPLDAVLWQSAFFEPRREPSGLFDQGRYQLTRYPRMDTRYISMPFLRLAVLLSARAETMEQIIAKSEIDKAIVEQFLTAAEALGLLGHGSKPSAARPRRHVGEGLLSKLRRRFDSVAAA